MYIVRYGSVITKQTLACYIKSNTGYTLSPEGGIVVKYTSHIGHCPTRRWYNGNAILLHHIILISLQYNMRMKDKL
jgi:hypothetical protein